jgi:hypothetical protein
MLRGLAVQVHNAPRVIKLTNPPQVRFRLHMAIMIEGIIVNLIRGRGVFRTHLKSSADFSGHPIPLRPSR